MKSLTLVAGNVAQPFCWATSMKAKALNQRRLSDYEDLVIFGFLEHCLEPCNWDWHAVLFDAEQKRPATE